MGFRWDRSTIDGIFATSVGFSKRKEHGLGTWALSIDLVKAFSRADLITGSNHIFAHLCMFGLQLHISRGATASKTEAIYFPPPRQAYAAADMSRFLVDGTGFMELQRVL